jgi:hypothetical protein
VAKWLAASVPEWIVLLAFGFGLPALMLVLQRLVHRWAPHWRRGENNDATGIMLSVAAVVYSVAIGLCVVTLWGQRTDASRAVDAEAMNLAAVAEGSMVLDTPEHERIRDGVLAYNRDVVAAWPLRIRGEASPVVSADLDALVTTVGQLTPRTEAQKAYVHDAVARLARATELRAEAVRQAREQQLPSALWVSVIGGSVVVLSLCLTCGIRDGTLRRILLAGVAATVGVNLFLAIELNYPFFGSVSVGPDSYRSVVTALEGSR